MMAGQVPVIFAVGPYFAYENCDGVGRFIVYVLFLGSILIWTIMLEKWLFLHRAKKTSEAFIKKMHGHKSPLALYREAQNDLSPAAYIYKGGVHKLLDFYGMTQEQIGVFNATGQYPCRKLKDTQLEALRIVLDHKVSDQIFEFEKNIGMLATAVSVSPFFGLFGTVWGIMIAFCGLAQAGKASMAALAPGVSGALLTTVVGLVVAIPSLIGYNLLTTEIRKLTVSMDNFVDSFMENVKLEQLEMDK